MHEQAERVAIGMDPHKRSVTIEVMTADEAIVGGGRFGTEAAGFAAMTDYVNRLRPALTDRVWAVEGCQGDRPPRRGPVACCRRAGRRRPAEAVGQGAGVRDRSRTQDRCHRRPLDRVGRGPDGRASAGGRRRAAGGDPGPGRPATVVGGGPHPDRVPAAPSAAGADPRRGEEEPVRRPSQSPARESAAP